MFRVFVCLFVYLFCLFVLTVPIIIVVVIIIANIYDFIIIIIVILHNVITPSFVSNFCCVKHKAKTHR